MSSEHFQAAHDSIYSTGIRLVQYLHEIGEGRRSEGNDNQGLYNIEDDLNNALKALQEQKYQVAVIAAMKAGDVLPAPNSKRTMVWASIDCSTDFLAHQVLPRVALWLAPRHYPLAKHFVLNPRRAPSQIIRLKV